MIKISEIVFSYFCSIIRVLVVSSSLLAEKNQHFQLHRKYFLNLRYIHCVLYLINIKSIMNLLHNAIDIN